MKKPKRIVVKTCHCENCMHSYYISEYDNTVLNVTQADINGMYYYCKDHGLVYVRGKVEVPVNTLIVLETTDEEVPHKPFKYFKIVTDEKA